jgi:hypothetical protein
VCGDKSQRKKTVQVCEETFFPVGRHKTFVIFRRAACRLNNVCGDKSQRKTL